MHYVLSNMVSFVLFETPEIYGYIWLSPNQINEHWIESAYSLEYTLIARCMRPTWGPSGADRTEVGPMLVPWTLLSGYVMCGFFLPGIPVAFRFSLSNFRIIYRKWSLWKHYIIPLKWYNTKRGLFIQTYISNTIHASAKRRIANSKIWQFSITSSSFIKRSPCTMDTETLATIKHRY